MYRVDIVPLSLNIPKSWVECWNLNSQLSVLIKPSISSPSISFFKNSSAISSHFPQASSLVRPVSSSACLWWLLVLLKKWCLVPLCCSSRTLSIASFSLLAVVGVGFFGSIIVGSGSGVKSFPSISSFMIGKAQHLQRGCAGIGKLSLIPKRLPSSFAQIGQVLLSVSAYISTSCIPYS